MASEDQNEPIGANEPDGRSLHADLAQGREFTADHVEDFAKRGITAQQAWEFGVRPVFRVADLPEGCPSYWTEQVNEVEDGEPWAYLPGRLYRFESPEGAVEYQLKPDRPETENGRKKKYVFRKGAASVLHAARHLGDDGPMLIVEGTHQTIACAVYAPASFSVYGIAGAQSWFKDGLPTSDLFVASGREVYICLDADGASNRHVYDAGTKLAANLKVCGARSVRFIRLGDLTGGTNGLDDYIGNIPVGRRAAAVDGLIKYAAAMKPVDKPQLPARKIPDPSTAVSDDNSTEIFDASGKLRAETARRLIVADRHPLLTSEFSVALYRDGVYKMNPLAFHGACAPLLGEDYRVQHVTNIESLTAAKLAEVEAFLPNHMSLPLMNVRNGMVDLRTGQLLPHDPRYMSNIQFPVEWDPDATCPKYEQWIRTYAGDQVDALEEVTAQMLNPAATPVYTLFLFGGSRTGKGTYLRLMQDMIGGVDGGAVSAESLHKLVTDPFSAANLYGKVLNVAADLASTPIDDISMFKMLTGQDPIPANRKYGKQFTFRNRAMMAFAANEIPQVAETSNAYSARQRPFRFSNSFVGAEDQRVEDELTAELPGILVRWVKAWQRRQDRGHELPEDPMVRLEFELRSNKVRKFVVEACDLVETETGSANEGSTLKELYRQFVTWCDDEGVKAMQQGKFSDRLRLIPGVHEVRIGPSRLRGFNVTVRPSGQWEPLDGAELAARADLRPKPPNQTNGTKSGHTDQVGGQTGQEIGKNSVCRETYILDPGQGEEHMSPAYRSLRENAPDLPARDARVPEQPPSTVKLDWSAPSEAPSDDLFAEAGAPAPACPSCGRDQETPPQASGVWYACRHCHPATFGDLR